MNALDEQFEHDINYNLLIAAVYGHDNLITGEDNLSQMVLIKIIICSLIYLL